MAENITLTEVRPLFLKESKIIHRFAKNKVQIIDKASGETCMIGDLEMALLQECTGERTITQIAEENRLHIGQNDLCRFVAQARSIGLLEGGDGKAHTKKSIMRLKLPLVRLSNSFLADRTTATVLKWLLYLAVLVSVGYLGYAVVKDSQRVLSIVMTTNYMSWDNIGYYFLSFFVLALFHELAHGIVLSSFGIVPGRMGVMLNYFHPSCYIEISGVNRIPSKSSRVQVWLAGVLMQICILALSMWLLLNVPMEEHVGRFVMVETLINFALIFFNLFYVIKLDGYNILCDLLDEPLLREKALADLLGGFRSEGSIKIRVVYLVVALISLLYMPVFVFAIITNVLNMFMPQFTTQMDIVVLSMIGAGSLGLIIRSLYGRRRRTA